MKHGHKRRNDVPPVNSDDWYCNIIIANRTPLLNKSSIRHTMIWSLHWLQYLNLVDRERERAHTRCVLFIYCFYILQYPMTSLTYVHSLDLEDLLSLYLTYVLWNILHTVYMNELMVLLCCWKKWLIFYFPQNGTIKYFEYHKSSQRANCKKRMPPLPPPFNIWNRRRSDVK